MPKYDNAHKKRPQNVLHKVYQRHSPVKISKSVYYWKTQKCNDLRSPPRAHTLKEGKRAIYSEEIMYKVENSFYEECVIRENHWPSLKLESIF